MADSCNSKNYCLLNYTVFLSKFFFFKGHSPTQCIRMVSRWNEHCIILWTIISTIDRSFELKNLFDCFFVSASIIAENISEWMREVKKRINKMAKDVYKKRARRIRWALFFVVQFFAFYSISHYTFTSHTCAFVDPIDDSAFSFFDWCSSLFRKHNEIGIYMLHKVPTCLMRLPLLDHSEEHTLMCAQYTNLKYQII